MVKIHRILIFILFFATAIAAEANEPPKLKDWINQFLTSKKRALVDQYRIALYNKSDGQGPTFFPITSAGSNKSILRLSGTYEWNLFLSLAQIPRLPKGKIILKIISQGMHAEHVLTCKKSCSLIHFPAKGKSTTLGEFERPGSLSKAEDWQTYFTKVLGYGAVILDRRQGFYLVGSFLPQKGENGTQAIPFKESADSFLLKTKKPEKSLLVSIENAENMMIFEKMTGTKEFPVGTKLLIGSNLDK